MGRNLVGGRSYRCSWPVERLTCPAVKGPAPLILQPSQLTAWQNKPAPLIFLQRAPPTARRFPVVTRNSITIDLTFLTLARVKMVHKTTYESVSGADVESTDHGAQKGKSSCSTTVFDAR